MSDGFVVLIRNPSNGRVMALTDPGDDDSLIDDPPIAVYDSREEAERSASDTPVCNAWPWVIVEAPNV